MNQDFHKWQQGGLDIANILTERNRNLTLKKKVTKELKISVTSLHE